MKNEVADELKESIQTGWNLHNQLHSNFSLFYQQLLSVFSCKVLDVCGFNILHPIIMVSYLLLHACQSIFKKTTFKLIIFSVPVCVAYYFKGPHQ